MFTKNPQSGLVKFGISTSEEKSVKQVQSSHFVNINVSVSFRSRYCRRRPCLSSLLLRSRIFPTMVTYDVTLLVSNTIYYE